MEMSDESDEEDWFISHVKVEVGAREERDHEGRETSQEAVVVMYTRPAPNSRVWDLYQIHLCIFVPYPKVNWNF